MRSVFALPLFTIIALNGSPYVANIDGAANDVSSRSGSKEETLAVRRAVDQAARAYMQSGQTIGLSIGIIKAGKTSFYNFGTTERDRQHPPTAHTLYPIGSITKTFTGALLARAVVEKRVSIDDDVRKYLVGDFPNLEFHGQPVRLYELINHTSGLPRNLPEILSSINGPEADAAQSADKEAAILDQYGRDEFVRDLHAVTLTWMPGEKFSYSNAAAQLLGLDLERVYAETYEEAIRSKITRPLKMYHTKVNLTAADRASMPKGSSAGGSFLPALSTRFPAAGALKSTTADMLKYIAWQLAERDPVVRLAHQPAGSTVWSQDNSFTVGLNWQILNSSGRRNIFQDGYVPGFHSMCVLCPELNLGIVVLSNEEVRSTPTQLSPLIDRILKAIDPRMSSTP